ncbi:MAG: TonB-dependent receptor [Bacteroidota bacterium]
MIKIIIIFFLLFLQVSNLFSQTIITGNIKTDKNQHVSGANIYLKGTIEGTNSDEQGNFLLSTDLRGEVVMVASCIGYKANEEPLDLRNDTIDLVIILRENDVELKEIVVYAGTFEAGDKKKSVVLNKLDMATNPVGFGDALSVLRTLPGTSNAVDEGGLFVRGGEQNEARTIIDGLSVESAYTAKMPNVPVRGRFSPMLFRGTVFSTGGYSAEYGQALSSVLILNSIDSPEKDEAGISLFMSGANLTVTKKWEKSSLSASTQYSNMSPYYGITGSNVKWDHEPESINQTIAYRQKAGKRGLLKILANLTMDNSSMFYHDLDTRIDELIALKNNDLFIVSSYRGVIGKDWLVSSGASFNYDIEKINMDEDNIETTKQSCEFKLVLTKPVNEKLNIKFGGNILNKDYMRNYIPLSGNAYKWNFNTPLIAALFESEVRVHKRISTRIGARAELAPLSDELYISPRFSLAYKTSVNSQLSFGYGSFSEQPLNEYLGYNNKLKSEQAEHFIFNYQLTKESRIFRIEAYYKDYDRLVKYDSVYSIESEAYNNNGYGYAKGIELFYRDSKSIKNGDFWISYSLIDSRRNYKDYSFSHPPFFLATHNLSLVYKHYIPKPDSYISAGYEFASGRPYIDPNVSNSAIQRTKSYNNLSLSIFHFTKLFGKFTMFYAQVSNILGIENIFGYRYADLPDEYGVYKSEPIIPVSRRFYLFGLFVSFTGKPEM